MDPHSQSPSVGGGTGASPSLENNGPAAATAEGSAAGSGGSSPSMHLSPSQPVQHGGTGEAAAAAGESISLSPSGARFESPDGLDDSGGGGGGGDTTNNASRRSSSSSGGVIPLQGDSPAPRPAPVNIPLPVAAAATVAQAGVQGPTSAPANANADSQARALSYGSYGSYGGSDGGNSSAPRNPSASASAAAPTPLKDQHTARLSDVQLRLHQMRQAAEGDTLMSRYLLSNSVRHQERGADAPFTPTATTTATTTATASDDATAHVSSVAELQRRLAVSHPRGGGPARPRFRNKQIFRRKLVLLGYQEVGKTSLRKCLESEPYFFRRLPDVRTTTGVEVNEKSVRVDGESVELLLSDFAGQEAYHSHTFFLTDRSIFGLVWKISAVEQDFTSSGINAREEERLYKWLAEVYAKYPRARVVLLATHLDELRVQGQRSVEMILNKVEGKVRAFIERIAGNTRADSDNSTNSKGNTSPGLRPREVIIGNFAVSCKTRLIIAAGDRHRHLSGQTISALLACLGEVAMDDCMADREYPSAVVPGRHARLMEYVEQLRQRQPDKLLMPMSDLVVAAVGLGIESDAELLQVARLMHCWDVVYLLNPHRIQENLFVMLHPRWLGRMAAALFSYAHVLRTPLHLRSFIAGLEYTISRAEAADRLLMRKGFLRWPLARVLFRKPLVDFLKRNPDDSDLSMCLQLLESMQVLYPVTIACDDFSVLTEECPVEPAVGRAVIRSEAVTRYFVPSLSPQKMPAVLKRLAPVLFHRGVRIRLEFNFLPDELWWRLQCRLAPFIKEVTVHQPYCPPADGINDDEDDNYQDDQSLMFDDVRLKEADDEHNRWKDALWLGGQRCRVLMYRESLTSISVCSAETQPRASEQVMEAVEAASADLLTEYAGVRRAMLVACPTADCAGWLPAEVVASSVSLTCDTCGKQLASDAVILTGDNSSSGGEPLQEEGEVPSGRRFSDALLAEVGELLSFCLSYHSCLHMCYYLGVPYRGPVPDRERTPSGGVPAIDPSTLPPEAHVEYLHALDKVVQAALFQSWVGRAQEREQRRRMLEVDPSPVLF